MPIKENKVAVVTGSSSGIGYQTALILARNGFSTFATMRSIEKSKNIMEIAKKNYSYKSFSLMLMMIP
jgi:NAD(P)-dependent dehydrogenase (short-subunit alcohol dehydrogenase family)